METGPQRGRTHPGPGRARPEVLDPSLVSVEDLELGSEAAALSKTDTVQGGSDPDAPGPAG